MGGVLAALGVILFINSCVLSHGQDSFPENFMFGVASSAYQIEGAWNEDGKGESIWDHEIHTQSSSIVKDDATPDTAADSYHKYKEDVALIEGMNLRHYKFSLSWTRILPTGFNDSVSNAGLKYYQNLIDELRKKNIIPMVTLYHWDLPQSIQDLGGWTNESTIQYFVDYARVAFQSFSNVDYWITVHEPKQVCREGYGNGTLAPFIFDSGISDYKCAYVLLKAHAAVYHMYKTEFSHLKGRISISLDGSWSEPCNNTNPDRKAAERRIEFEFGMFANPIFNKNWPQMLSSKVNDRSKKEGRDSSRLHNFTEEEISEIHGTADFMAFNYYGARSVKNIKKVPTYIYGNENDMGVTYCKNESWTEMPNGLSIVPWSIQSFLGYIKNNFGNPEIIITGNGVADEDLVHDNIRINYIADHLKFILKAINENGVNVTGYTYCNLLDSFEWNHGYGLHFGLFSVNMTDINKIRKAKDAVDFYRHIATSSHIPVETSTASTSSHESSGSTNNPIPTAGPYTDTVISSPTTGSSKTCSSSEQPSSTSSTTVTDLPTTGKTPDSSETPSTTEHITTSLATSLHTSESSDPSMNPVTPEQATSPSSGSIDPLRSLMQLLVAMIILLRMSN